jgi:hypothetical protein
VKSDQLLRAESVELWIGTTAVAADMSREIPEISWILEEREEATSCLLGEDQTLSSL